MSELDRLREQIGALDRTVLEALNERVALVRRVNEHKQRAGSPLIDAEREAELLKELAAANPGPLSEGAVQALFAAVLDVMKQEVRGEPRSQAPSREQPPSPRGAPIDSLAVVGTGLLGSSVALAAQRAGVAEVAGWDAEGSTLREALGAKAIARAAASLRDAVGAAELVVVAVPVGVLVPAAREVLEAAPESATVTDVGSTKRALAAAIIRSRAARAAARPVRRRTSSTARPGS